MQGFLCAARRPRRQLGAGPLRDRRAFAVEQDRVLARGRRERSLGRAEDPDACELDPRQRVDRDHIDAAARECPRISLQHVLGAKRLDRPPHDFEEPLERDLVFQRRESLEAPERLDDLDAALHVARQQLCEEVELLRPRRPARMRRHSPAQVFDELRELGGVRDAVCDPLGLVLRLVLARETLLQQPQPLRPLFDSGDDASLTRHRVPARGRDPFELLVQLAGQPRVGEEVHHRLPRVVRLVEVQQRQRLATDRPLRQG